MGWAVKAAKVATVAMVAAWADSVALEVMEAEGSEAVATEVAEAMEAEGSEAAATEEEGSVVGSEAAGWEAAGWGEAEEAKGVATGLAAEAATGRRRR